MATASIAEAKARLSELLRMAAQGETVLILNRGRPVARLVASEPESGREARWLAMERLGVVRRGSEPPDATLLDDEAPHLSAANSLLAALVADRQADR